MLIIVIYKYFNTLRGCSCFGNSNNTFLKLNKSDFNVSYQSKSELLSKKPIYNLLKKEFYLRMVDLDKVLGIVLDDFFATLQKIRKMISKNKYFKDYDFYTSHFKVIFNKFKTIKIDFLIQVQDCFEILKKIYFAESEICNEYLDGMYQLTKIYFQRVIKTLKQSTYYILNTINTKKSLFNDDFVKIQNIINIEINNLTIFYNNENENIIQNIVTFLREDFFNDDIYEMKRKIIKPEPIVYCTYNFNLFLFNSIIIKNKEYTDKLSEKLTDKKIVLLNILIIILIVLMIKNYAC